MTVALLQADAERLPLADKSVQLTLGSPPYTDCRTYDDGTIPSGHVISRDTPEWVEWMLDVTTEALRVTDGAVVWIVGCPTRNRNYQPAAEGLMWEWWKRGGSAYRPCYWHRVGIPGSGGDQWFRADVEYVMCFKRDGKLPWTDNTAMGHPPKWAPGGAMAHRLSNGSRVNQWGPVSSQGRGNGGYRANGDAKPRYFNGTSHTKRRPDGEMESQNYDPPVLANPGVLVEQFYSASDVARMLDDAGNFTHTAVGGGQMGDKCAHENEAPFPEDLAEWFIRSLCPLGGTVLDPFSGSGTTIKVAKSLGRSGIGVDLRTSQCQLGKRRTSSVQLSLLDCAT